VQEAGCGRVVDEIGDVEAFARAVVSLATVRERDALGKRGRAAVLGRFELEASAEALARLAGLPHPRRGSGVVSATSARVSR
jgi:glycosyltransferase involved in cell wall biosynthesis